MSLYIHEGYQPGHPWYYFLGGKPLGLHQIAACVRHSRYRGYRYAEIDSIDRMSEPTRSANIKAFRKEVLSSLRWNYRRYLEVLKILNNLIPEPTECTDAHGDCSIKHNHIYNDIAHLIAIDKLVVQRDLFSL